MGTEAYIEQVYRNLKGELSPIEFQAFNKMTAENAELASLRIEIEDAWDVSGSEETIVKPKETEKLFENITKKKSASVFSLRNLITGIAAMFVLALGSVWLMRDQIEIYTKEGLYTLNDNTTVELREGSRLEVSPFSNKERKVSLEGEAFFKVERDEKRPFTVNASNTEILVLGTSFLVKENKESVFVDLKEGKVRFSDLKTSESIELTKGMKAEYNISNGLKVVEYQNLSAWMDGTYQYIDQDLSQIVNELSLIFNANIKVENQELLNCRLSAIFNAENLEDILNQLAGQLEMNAKKNGQDWILSGGKCK